MFFFRCHGAARFQAFWGDLFGIEGSNSLGNFVSPLMGASRPAMDVANHEGWVIVADSSWEGYTEVPVDIMCGYTRLFHEAMEELKAAAAYERALATTSKMGAVVALRQLDQPGFRVRQPAAGFEERVVVAPGRLQRLAAAKLLPPLLRVERRGLPPRAARPRRIEEST